MSTLFTWHSSHTVGTLPALLPPWHHADYNIRSLSHAALVGRPFEVTGSVMKLSQTRTICRKLESQLPTTHPWFLPGPLFSVTFMYGYWPKLWHFPSHCTCINWESGRGSVWTGVYKSKHSTIKLQHLCWSVHDFQTEKSSGKVFLTCVVPSQTQSSIRCG